jgi:hypothetical protein
MSPVRPERAADGEVGDARLHARNEERAAMRDMTAAVPRVA